jgi:hypothetical protein
LFVLSSHTTQAIVISQQVTAQPTFSSTC